MAPKPDELHKWHDFSAGQVPQLTWFLSRTSSTTGMTSQRDGIQNWHGSSARRAPQLARLLIGRAPQLAWLLSSSPQLAWLPSGTGFSARQVPPLAFSTKSSQIEYYITQEERKKIIREMGISQLDSGSSEL